MNVLQWFYLNLSGVWSYLDFVFTQFHLLLFLSPINWHASQNPFTKSRSFSSSKVNYDKLDVKLATITALHSSDEETGKAAFLKLQRNHPRAQNVI